MRKKLVYIVIILAIISAASVPWVLYLKRNQGHIGIGVPPIDGANIYTYEEFTNALYHTRGIQTEIRAMATTNSSAYVVIGGEFLAGIGSSNTKDWTGQVVIRGSDNEVGTLAGSTGTVAGAANIYGVSNISGATVTNLYGVFVGGDIGTGNTITNQYGIWIADRFRGGGANYAIYTKGATQSYFGGHLGIATLPNPQAGINYIETYTNPGEHKFGIMSSITSAETRVSTPCVSYGGYFASTIGAANTQNWTDGISIVYSEANIITGATGTISNIRNFYGQSVLDGATVSNRYGVLINNASGAGTLINQYGLYIGNMTKGSSKNYAIFTAGGSIHFAGLPTSDPGIAGDLWSDNGILKISQ